MGLEGRRNFLLGAVVQRLETLVEQARRSNTDAYGTIVMRFQDMAVGCAYSLL
ncbi:MAG: hypothetical protein QGH20_10505 [Candidatus Latescibacteria bacterium]|jgi:hypothetical protein|nr:hypothetical protein [Candidatus Latescibacterota bacterium]